MDGYGLFGRLSFGLDGGNPRIDSPEELFLSEEFFVTDERVAERGGATVVVAVGS